MPPPRAVRRTTCKTSLPVWAKLLAVVCLFLLPYYFIPQSISREVFTWKPRVSALDQSVVLEVCDMYWIWGQLTGSPANNTTLCDIIGTDTLRVATDQNHEVSEEPPSSDVRQSYSKIVTEALRHIQLAALDHPDSWKLCWQESMPEPSLDDTSSTSRTKSNSPQATARAFAQGHFIDPTSACKKIRGLLFRVASLVRDNERWKAYESLFGAVECVMEGRPEHPRVGDHSDVIRKNDKLCKQRWETGWRYNGHKKR